MLEILTRWPRENVAWPWLDARELTHQDERWEALDDGEVDGVASLVTSDLVPWVLTWPTDALRLLRNVMCYGLITDTSLLGEASEQLVVTDDALDAIWYPLWRGVFGDGPDEPEPEGILVVTEFADQVQIEQDHFGQRFMPPDPVLTWEWLRPARGAQTKQRLERRDGIDLTRNPQAALEFNDPSLTRNVAHQGLVAIEAASYAWRSGPEPWRPPAEGLVDGPLGGGFPLISNAYYLFGPAEPPARRMRPYDELQLVVAEAAKALDIPEGGVVEMASAARRLEELFPSVSEVYVTWAVLAEAVQESLDTSQCLQFRALHPDRG